MKPSIRHVAAAIAVALLSLSTRAADPPPADDRSTPGTVVPSSGTTASQPAATPPTLAAPPAAEPAPRAATAPAPTGAPASRPLPARSARVVPAPAPKVAGSLSGTPTADCAALRRRYAQSQACFEPYRLANGGIRPEAFKRCRQVPDPATQCGPEVEPPGQ